MWFANIFVQDFVASITEKREQIGFCSKHIDLCPTDISIPLENNKQLGFTVFRRYRNIKLALNCVNTGI